MKREASASCRILATMNVKKSNFNFYIYTLFFRSFLCISCDDSVLIVQNTRRRKVIKQRVPP